MPFAVSLWPKGGPLELLHSATRAQFDPSLVKEETMLTMEKMKTLVPCVGTERLREYANFIKEGNFYPVTVLDPEVGKRLILSRVKLCSGPRLIKTIIAGLAKNESSISGKLCMGILLPIRAQYHDLDQ